MDRDSAILKVEMTGVCGTDKHIFKGEASRDPRQVDLPRTSADTRSSAPIVEIGENAARTMDFDHQPLKPGDRVALAVEVNCGECWYCRHHYNNTTCENQVMAYGIHPNADTAPYLRGGFCRVHVHHAGHLPVQDPRGSADGRRGLRGGVRRRLPFPGQGDRALCGGEGGLRAGGFGGRSRQRTSGHSPRHHGQHSRGRAPHRHRSRRSPAREGQGALRRRHLQRIADDGRGARFSR